MKILIWFVCILVATLLQSAGKLLTLNSDPTEAAIISFLYTVIVYSFAFVAAKSLCGAVDDKRKQAKDQAFSPEPSDPTISPAAAASQPEAEEEIITTATAALEELESQAAPAAPVKVSWKAPSPKAPSTPRPKRARSKLLVPVCVLAVLLLLSLGGNGYQYLRDNSRSAQIQVLNTQLKDADTEIAVLENRAENMEENRDYYRNLAYERGLEADENKIATDFFYSHIAFVLDDGTNLYHSYCCPYVQDQGTFTYWAFNIDAAVDYGYSPCPLCKDNFE